MITIDVKIDGTALERALAQLISAAQDTEPCMVDVAGILAGAAEDAFDGQRDPVTGAKWVPLNRHYAAQRAAEGHAGKMLQLSGGLATSIQRQHGNGYAVAGTNHQLAAMHQFGATTRAHIIRAKNKKALNIPGIGPRKMVHHPGSEIPRRRFLGIGPVEREEIRLALLAHLQCRP